MPLTAAVASPIAPLCIVRSEDLCLMQGKNIWQSPVGLKPLRLQFHPSVRNRIIYRAFKVKHACRLNHASRATHAAVICAAALNSTCAAEQTQTVTRQSSTITVAPTQGKEKSPELDDGGTGFPPRDNGNGGDGGDGGGGGGGGGSSGGGHWLGGFLLFGFLAFLLFLKEQEGEGPCRDEGRRQKSYAY